MPSFILRLLPKSIGLNTVRIPSSTSESLMQSNDFPFTVRIAARALDYRNRAMVNIEVVQLSSNNQLKHNLVLLQHLERVVRMQRRLCAMSPLCDGQGFVLTPNRRFRGDRHLSSIPTIRVLPLLPLLTRAGRGLRGLNYEASMRTR